MNNFCVQNYSSLSIHLAEVLTCTAFNLFLRRQSLPILKWGSVAVLLGRTPSPMGLPAGWEGWAQGSAGLSISDRRILIYTITDKSTINPALINCTGNGKELSMQQPRELKTKYNSQRGGERVSLWKHFCKTKEESSKSFTLLSPLPQPAQCNWSSCLLSLNKKCRSPP